MTTASNRSENNANLQFKVSDFKIARSLAETLDLRILRSLAGLTVLRSFSVINFYELYPHSTKLTFSACEKIQMVKRLDQLNVHVDRYYPVTITIE
jgi:hypothetical protein